MGMEIIERVNLTAAQGTLQLASIPQGYQDLYILLSLRGGSNSSRLGITTTFNSDTSALYSYRLMFAYEGGQLTDSLSSKTPAQTPELTISANTSTAGTYGAIRIYIPDYTAAVSKPLIADYIAENNSTSSYVLGTTGRVYASNDPITSIEFGAQGHTFMQFSSATLYGISAGSDGNVTVSS